MNFYFIAAAILTLAISLAHSWLGERYILMRLFRRQNIPHLHGSDVFTKRTLRFAWHVTTVAWCGVAALLLALALLPLDTSSLILSKIIAAHERELVEVGGGSEQSVSLRRHAARRL